MTFVRDLYTYEGKTITDIDFFEALKSLGVVEGDTLMVHSDTKSFGKLVVSSAEELLGALVDIFEKCVGNSGAVIMPTFTYSFGAGKDNVFDVEKSKSTVGSLTEYFRHIPDVVRTIQPMMSVAVWGADTKKIVEIGKDTLGSNSIFDNLRTQKGKIVLFGTDFNACTFLHYVEQMHAVPYRFMKTFAGTIIDHGRTYEDIFTYFVRPLDVDDEKDFNLAVPYLQKHNVLRQVTVGAATITLVTAGDLFEVAMKALDRDSYAFLKKPPKQYEK